MKQSQMLRKQKDTQVFYIVYVALLWSKDILMRYFRILLLKLPILWVFADEFISLVYVLFFLLALRNFASKVYIKDAVAVIVCIALLVVYYLVYPALRHIYDDFAPIFVQNALPMYLVGVSMYQKKKERLLDVLYVISLATVISVSFYTLFLSPISEDKQAAGAMDLAYKYVPHLCMVVCHTIKRVTPVRLAVSVLGSVILLSLGTRGVLVCLGVCIVFAFVFIRKIKNPVRFSLIALSLLLIFIYGGVWDTLYDFAERNGFSLRIFEKIKEGSVGDSTGRNALAKRVLEYIGYFALGGMGPFSDRYVANGYYAHNFLLEIWLEFGIFLGSLLIFLVLRLFYNAGRALLQMQDQKSQCFFFSLLTCHFIKLFLSGCYLTEGGFFLLVGYSVAVLRAYRHEKPVLLAQAAIAAQPSEPPVPDFCILNDDVRRSLK